MTFTISPAAQHKSLDSSCWCSYCPDCLLAMLGPGTCTECGTELVELHDCQGCHEEALLEFASDLLTPWVQENPSTNGYYVAEVDDLARRFTRRVLFSPDDGTDLPELLARPGPWTQQWDCEPWHEGKLAARQVFNCDQVEFVELRPATDTEVEQL